MWSADQPREPACYYYADRPTAFDMSNVGQMQTKPMQTRLTVIYLPLNISISFWNFFISWLLKILNCSCDSSCKYVIWIIAKIK